MAGVVGDAGFHFDEHNRAAVDGHDVDLAAMNMRAALDDRVAESLENHRAAAAFAPPVGRAFSDRRFDATSRRRARAVSWRTAGNDECLMTNV